jgi:hypothetical protein
MPKKTAKLLDSKSLMLSFWTKPIWAGFFSIPSTIVFFTRDGLAIAGVNGREESAVDGQQAAIGAVFAFPIVDPALNNGTLEGMGPQFFPGEGVEGDQRIIFSPARTSRCRLRSG